MLYINDSPNELNRIRILSSQIKMEAFVGGDINTLLNESLPVLVEDVKSFFNRFTPITPSISLTSNENTFLKYVSKHAFLDIAPLSAYVPEGLECTYKEYSHPLTESVLHASNIINDVLSEYTVFLSHLISSKDVKLSITSFNKKYENLEKTRLVLNHELGKCFKLGSTKSEVSIGDVVYRNSEWKEVIDLTRSCTQTIESVDRKILNKKIAESVTLLNIILKKISNNELNGMSPEGINNLSTGAYQVAAELEFFSITYYRVLAFVNSIDKTIDHFNKIIKE